MSAQHPGHEVIARYGWLRAHRYLLARRLSQIAVLALFLAGPCFGLWILKGNLSASLLFDSVPLTDPLAFLQILASRHWPTASAWIGATIVAACWLFVGGRVFCAWVCPMNIVTDLAAWLRRRLRLRTGRAPHAATRYWLLAALLLASAASGVQVWETVNPVSMLHRGLVFGLSGAAIAAFAIFGFDLLLAGRGWCSHVCPTGAMYRLLDRPGLLRIAAPGRRNCDDCMDCYAVCPEPAVIHPALKKLGQDHTLILDAACTRCGRCVDVCSKEVFRLGSRFNGSER